MQVDILLEQNAPSWQLKTGSKYIHCVCVYAESFEEEFVSSLLLNLFFLSEKKNNKAEAKRWALVKLIWDQLINS